ncbi:hypothetical protein H2198_008265 [Neophaeococcomyces mojaviensis]|uniref:Uncharacterized protein n=1 Tax=Neophaeococcomyces mojaviensis TaxID=3383035 RepID=A0ACC2ZXM5_9EURO|nr:hypothetical protein H2198_008265 [Knufia sp. JES_112]
MKRSSHLTRAVFRALIANRPYVPPECLQRAALRNAPTLPPSINHLQKRTFFEFLTGDTTPKSLEGSRATPKNVEVAVGRLVDLLKAKKTRSRPPTNGELTDALKFLFAARLENGIPLTRNEVFLATESYKHLQERDLVLSENAGSLAEDDLASILSALALQSPKERFRSDVRALAELVHQSFSTAASRFPEPLQSAYIAILAQTGSALEARDKLRSIPATAPANAASLWLLTLKGLFAEARDREFWKALEEFDEKFGGLPPKFQEELVELFAKADRIWDAQKVFGMSLDSNAGPTPKCIAFMLEMSLRVGQMNLAEELANELSARVRSSPDDVIGTLILYHAARDPRFEELRQLIHSLLQSNQGDVTMDTFNNVIEYALQRNNPTLADALTQIAESEGFTPNGKTYALRLQHTLDQHHFREAEQIYSQMLNEDMPSDNFDIPILNRFLTTLAFRPDPNHELLMRVVDSLIERDADITAEALAGLCHHFLHRGEIDELTGLLRHRIDLYPLPERARVSQIFIDFIQDTSISTQRAYNAYDLFRHAFPETPCSARLPILQSFFDRKRPDLACAIFSHMRQMEADSPARPNAAAYQKCFEGIAQNRDIDGLQTIYNMLKLDLSVELTTHIRNGIMLAYIACQMPWQAIIDHFYKIMDSREGPTYSSFEVALRACETWPPYGSFEARKIIAIMQSWNLEITKSLYDTYVGAIAGQCEFESAVELIENMERDIGEPPDAFTIGTFYNAIPWQYRKDEVEQWAKQAYPELWQELRTFGEEVDEEFEVKYFKIDRSIDIDDEPLFKEGEWRPEITRAKQAEIEPLRLEV